MAARGDLGPARPTSSGEVGKLLRTRREVLIAGMSGAFGLALAACASDTTSKAASIAPAGSDIGAIDHVVFLMHENRSFDHYFGSYRGVRGFDDPGATDVFRQAWPDSTQSGVSSLMPFHLDTARTDAECTFDLTHEWRAQHLCWDGGDMSKFVATHTSARYEGPEQGVLTTMGHYTRSDLEFWYALADAFTIGDNYHCSVMGPTHPNRLHALSGTLDPAGEAGGPIIVTNSDKKFLGSATWRTMPEVLQDKGISWKVYNPPGAAYQPSNSISIAVSDNILLYFKRHTSDPSSPLYQNAFGSLFPNDFTRDVANDTLPSVSWVCPPIGYDEHPPSPPAAGQWFAHQVLSALVANPKVWAKTALFIMYDENDGFFDHVKPPTPPKGTAGEYLTSDPLPDASDGITGPIGLGFRVPLLVVSPFSRGGYVCSEVFDHTSQLRFLETRFGVTAPNISDWRRKARWGTLTATVEPSKPRPVGADPAGGGAAQRHGHGPVLRRSAPRDRRERPGPLPGAVPPDDAHPGAGKAWRRTTV